MSASVTFRILFSPFLRACRYRWYCLTDPDRIDFVGMGLGIEARAERYSAQWAAHLSNSQTFIEQSLRSCSGTATVTVLGAGRLLDLPLDLLHLRNSELELLDADPSAVVSWRGKLGGRVTAQPWSGRAIDLTGILDEWTDSLKNTLTGEGARADARSISLELTRLARMEPPLHLLAQCSGIVISLNLLSQLGVYWRERVERVFRRYAPELLSEGEGTALQAAIDQTVVRLEQHHLALLESSQASDVILLTDRYFLHYLPDRSEWQEEPALMISQVELAGFDRVSRESWLWHIRPAGSEGEPQGQIHEVEAIHFRRQTR